MTEFNCHIEIRQPHYWGAFALDESGELLETVDFDDDGRPEWDAAGICDPHRGSNEPLQAGLKVALRALDEEEQESS